MQAALVNLAARAVVEARAVVAVVAVAVQDSEGPVSLGLDNVTSEQPCKDI